MDGAAGRDTVYRHPETVRTTMLQVNAPRVLPILGLPIALAAVGVVVSYTAWRGVGRMLSALSLLAFALVSGFSIGLYYLPSALAMHTAAMWRFSLPPPPAGQHLVANRPGNRSQIP